MDDDDFGDLYGDFGDPSLSPHQSNFSSSTNPSPNSDLNLQSDSRHDSNLYNNDKPSSSDPNFITIPSTVSNQTPIAPKVEISENGLFVGASTLNSIEGNMLIDVKKENVDEGVRVLEATPNGKLLDGSVRVSRLAIEDVQVEDMDKNEDIPVKVPIFTNKNAEVKAEIDVGVDDLDSEPLIPGLSSSGVAAGGAFIPGIYDEVGGAEETRREDARDAGGEEDDWDSDSEDDLQIVLNDKTGHIGMDGNQGMGSDDEDGEDLIIVADGDQSHQPMEQLDWGDDPTQGADGERNEAGDAAKVNGGVINNAGTRIGYGNHLYPSHHSQFKYVRPGAAVVPGGAIVGPGGAPGQVRPLVSMGPVVGRGRGDWRPVGMKTAPGMPRPFHPGFGAPAWGNNSAGRGLEFTLPSHKTAFDIDIETFEDKPWRNTGIDVSDFFNFGLDEENWKEYCKQLEQLRLEATMQSRIRVYTSGRSEPDYDPDLPPELAAAAAIQDGSAENAHLAKANGGPMDMVGQDRGASRTRPPMIPTGRAIQVEGGYGERLPSIDTRPPRMRDSDAIIEIVLQGSGDDDPMTENDAGNDAQRDDLRGDEEEDIAHTEYFDRPHQPYNGRRREFVGRREPFMGSDSDIHEGNGLLPFPQEASQQYNSGSRGRGPSYSGGTYHDRRWSQGTARDRHSRQTSERGTDGIPCGSIHDSEREKSGGSVDREPNQEARSPDAIEAIREPSIELKADLDNEVDLGDSSVALEAEGTAKDVSVASDADRDGSPVPCIKRQKLSSRVEQPTVQDIGSVDGLRTTRSSDNSKARSGSSRDHQKRQDGEEEVVQERRSRRMEDMKRRRDDDDHSFRRKDDQARDGRQEMERSRVFAKGREDPHISYPYRDWDPNPTHPSRVKAGDIERPSERDNSVGARQRRDDDTHVRRLKDDMRKREHVDEVGYRQRNKVRESEKSDRDEHLHSRKRLDNGDWRGHHDKDVGPRQREKDDNLIRHEILDDPHTRRRKEEEHLRREHAEKEVLHGYRAREDTNRRKRERDDSLDPRKREEQPRVRDKLDDNHSVRHREETWRQRERDEKRLKQTHEDLLSNREREGRNSVRSGRDLEDKPWVGNTRVREESKGLGSDKDYPYKDKRRPNEHSKRSDRVEEDAPQQHRGRENVYPRENHLTPEERNPRHERSNTHNDRPVIPSESQLMQKERHRDSRRSKDRAEQNAMESSKRKQEDHNAHRSDKVSGKAVSEQETSGRQARLSSSTSVTKKTSHEQERPSKRHREDPTPSEDDQHNSKRGRSKLERWTSNKDKDDTNKDTKDLPSSEPNEQQPPPVVEEVQDQDNKTEVGHLDTVAKLKKRSERFKTPMPEKEKEREKDSMGSRKLESESLMSSSSTIKDEITTTVADAEIKPERPARKRRWISS